MATASPGNDQSTHHLVLTQGATSVGLVICDNGGNPEPLAFSREDIPGQSLRVYSGSMKHHDRDVPFEPIAQTDWSSGRGGYDFDADASKYNDGFCVDTGKAGRVLLGGFASYGDITRNPQHWTYRRDATAVTYRAYSITSAYWQFATRVTPSTTANVSYVTIYVRRTVVGASPPVVSIRANVADAPNVEVGSGAMTLAQFNALPFGVWTPARIALSAPVLITSGIQFWLAIGSSSSANANGFDILTEYDAISDAYLRIAAGTWEYYLGGVNPYYRITGADAQFKSHFFEYKGSTFAAMRYSAATVARLFINGDQGVATGAQTSTTLKDTSKAWTIDEWIGCIVRINRGTGSDQPRAWRVITSNTADTLTVAAWDVTPVTANAEYSIIASDKWTEIGTSGAQLGQAAWTTQVITDVLSVNGAVYFAHGEAVAMSRLVRYNNAGTWTTVWATETGAVTYLKQANDQQGAFIWGASGGAPAQIVKALVSDWTAGTGGANLAFSAAIGVGDLMDRITSMERYTDYGNLHILKTSGIYQVIDDRPYLYQARALENSADYRNGRACLAYDTFLYFSWHNSLLRYYRGMLDRIGPDREEVPLPTDRAGSIMALAGYSNLIIAAIDAGADGYSSIMAYNGQGWHELYRAPGAGMRIWSLRVQTIDGDAVDRLWFSCGSDLLWIPLSVDPYYHPYTPYNFYPFAPGGSIQTGWLFNELNEVLKYWHSIEYQGEMGSNSSVRVYYEADDDTTYTLAGTGITDTAEFALTNVTGNRLRVMYALSTTSSRYTPNINCTIVEAIKRIPKAYADTMLVRICDDDVDLLGNPDDHSPNTALGKLNTLTTLESAAIPVTITSMVKALDGKTAFMELNNQRPYKVLLRDGQEAFLCQLMLIEV